MMNSLPSDTTTPPPRRRLSRTAQILLSIIAMLLIPALYTGGFYVYNVARIPLIPEPIDFDAIVAQSKIPDEENAVKHYLYSARICTEFDDSKLQTVKHLDTLPWDQLPNFLQQAVQQNTPAFNAWLEGTDKPKAFCFNPAILGPPGSQLVSQGIRKLIRLIPYKARELQSRGSHDEAWKYLAGGLRTSAHLAQGGQIIDRLTGIAGLAVVSPAIQHWAENPQVSPAQLRQAATDLDQIFTSIPSASHTLKFEYTSTRDIAACMQLAAPSGNMMWRWTMGRLYDSSTRLQRHAMWNLLSQCDLPRSERKWQSDGGLFIDLHPNGPQLPSDQIAKLAKRDIFYKLYAPAHRQFMEAVDRDLLRRSALQLILALQRHHRDQGRFPTDLKSLVPEYLPSLPPNPYAPVGQSLNYRLESDRVILWNQGDDHPVKPEDGYQWSPPPKQNPDANNPNDFRIFWTIDPPGTRPLPADPADPPAESPGDPSGK